MPNPIKILSLILVILFLNVGCSLDFNVLDGAVLDEETESPVAWNPSKGLPDLTFGGHGFVQHKVNLPIDDAEVYNSMVVDSSGKIYLAGRSKWYLVVRSVNADGTLNTAFGDGGVKFFNGAIPSNFSRIELIDDGGTPRLLISCASQKFYILKLDLQGRPVASFGNQGLVTSSSDLGSYEKVQDLQVLTDGSVLVAGTTSSGSYSKVKLTKVTPLGEVDTSFGTSGSLTVTGAESSEFRDFAVDSAGRIVLATRIISGTSIHKIWRFTSTGVVDTSWNGNGAPTTITNAAWQSFSKIQTDGSGKVLLFGYLDGALYIRRLTSTGSVDNTAGGELSYSGGYAEDVIPKVDGSYRIFGIYLGNFGEWLLDSSGTLSLVASGAPFVFPDGYSASDEGADKRKFVAETADGGILWIEESARFMLYGNTVNKDSVLFKIKSDGTIDATFAEGKAKIFDDKVLVTVDHELIAIEISSSDSIYSLSKIDMGREGYGTVVYNYKSDGTLNNGFGMSGYKILSKVVPLGMKIDKRGRLLIRGMKNIGGADWQSGLWRLTTTGDLDTTFASGGEYIFPLPANNYLQYPGTSQTYPMNVDSSGNIYLTQAYYDDDTYDEFLAIQKLNPQGIADSSFGQQGLLQIGSDIMWNVKDFSVKPDGYIYILDVINDTDLYLTRVSASTGQMDSSFGSMMGWKLLNKEAPAGDRLSDIKYVLDGEDRVVVFSLYMTPANTLEWYPDRFTIDRFMMTTGEVDTSFNGGNSYNDSIAGPVEGLMVNLAGVDKDGRIIFVKEETLDVDSDDWTLNMMALTKAGVLDNTFGANGIFDLGTLVPNFGNAYGDRLQIGTSGKIAASLGDYIVLLK